jgi:hypothetical protein
MSFAENPHKVRNIVNAQQGQFRELYHRLVVGLPGVHWAGEKVEVRIFIRYTGSSSLHLDLSGWSESLIGWDEKWCDRLRESESNRGYIARGPTNLSKMLKVRNHVGKGIGTVDRGGCVFNTRRRRELVGVRPY